jgi:hypothetical protein
MTDGPRIDVNDPEYDDPICAEIRQIRDDIAAEFNYDLGAIVRSMQERERHLPPERLVSLPPRSVVTGGLKAHLNS